MLQTDEVDDDYFTPIPSTSLANIFGAPSRLDKGTENDSLKYTPPKAQNVTQNEKAEDEAKHTFTECVFACALIAHEWAGNVYSTKGKLGFAILTVTKNNSHNIVLYDSNKTTVSNTSITEKLEVTVKDNTYVSYYDNLSKYWSLYGTEEEINKIVELLNKFNAKVKCSSHIIEGPPSPNYIEDQEQKETIPVLSNKVNTESDTDSSLNRRTKDSILSRMASMGHSVLPPHHNTISTEKTSDSSDTNTTDDHPKVTRHKPVKNIVKRITIEKHVPETLSVVGSHKIIASKADPSLDRDTHQLYTQINGQLVPVTNNSNIISNFESSRGNDMGLFISEQRISNSELRININRVTDKVDQVLNKMKQYECTDKINPTSDFQIEILQKLMAEYENKIKFYEEVMISNNIENIVTKVSASASKLSKVNQTKDVTYQNTIRELEIKIEEKNCDNYKLNEEIRLLKKKLFDVVETQTRKENDLLKEINDLKQALFIKDEELANIDKKWNENMTSKHLENAAEVESKLKNIMNDTFRSICVNFENSSNYSGESVKRVIATVIKKATIESLQ